MSNIAKAFENGKAFIPFITCGDPDLETTGAIVREAVKNGADLIELGIPFSDPTVESVVIQRATMRALSGSVTTDKIFDFVRELREEITVPLVFVTYANVAFSYGAERFIKTCADIGIDGIIFHDLPFEEKGEFQPYCKQYGVDLISTISHTSKDRIEMIAKQAEGFLYIMPHSDITTLSKTTVAELASLIKLIRDNTDIPCAIDIDAVTPEQAKALSPLSDGIIAGSAIVNIMEQSGNSVSAIGGYIGEIKAAMKLK